MRCTTITLLLFVTTLLAAQSNISIEGYVFEKANRGFLNQVELNVAEIKTGQVMGKAYSDINGFFQFDLPANQSFIISAKKSAFNPFVTEFTTKVDGTGKVFLSLEMEREPGYIFEGTLAPTRESEQPVDAIIGARIEVYNNTTGKQELDIPNSDSYSFEHVLYPGNHYTFMIRKKGFYNKRIEAHVDIDGCILCFEGTGEVRPGVLDNLTDELSKGSLLSNIEMAPIELGKGIEIENIYYDYDKYDIRADAKPILDNLIGILKDNPALIVEMGSHTDSRGRTEYNRDLSENRAKAVVNYLLENGSIPTRRLSAFGYGESEIKNRCSNGVDCSDKEHQSNRRTEMKVVGILDYDPYSKLSLAEIIQKEVSEDLIDDMIQGKSEQIEATKFEDLPPEVQRDILRSQGKLANEETIEKPKKEEPMPTPIEPAKPKPLVIERVMSFPEGFNGYSIRLDGLSGTNSEKEEKLLSSHGKIIKYNDDYYLGSFKEKKTAKKYRKSLLKKYPAATVIEFPLK